jgi:hypothetical protein
MPTSKKMAELFRNFFVNYFQKTNCMKTNSLNVLFNHRAIIGEKSSQVMKQKLLL